MQGRATVGERADRHGALGEPARLAIVDELTASDRSPMELGRLVGVESNLLAHHLDVLERVGLIERSRSSGDGRRRYVRLQRDVLERLSGTVRPRLGRALFICTANSARSPLAAAIWRQMTGAPADSAGTHPAAKVSRGAVAAAARAGIDLRASVPKRLDVVASRRSLVVTVCDQAHEELEPDESWLHWSILDPVPVGSNKAFDAVVEELRVRISTVAGLEGGAP